MSTSATPQGLGECVVCGKESSTRCSKCNSAGLDWMFFCGQEHQKLIWFAHKRVCGVNPFAWPAWTKAEKKRTMELMDVRIPHPGVGAIAWFGQQQLVNPKLSADEHEKRFVNDMEAASSLDQSLGVIRNNIDIRDRSYKRALRLTSGSPMTLETPRDVTAKIILAHPFDYLASLGSQTAYFNDVELTRSQWFSKLQNRSLIAIVLGALWSREAGGRANGVLDHQSFKYFAFSALRLQDTIESLEKAHPGENHLWTMLEIDFLLARIGMTFHVKLEKEDDIDT